METTQISKIKDMVKGKQFKLHCTFAKQKANSPNAGDYLKVRLIDTTGICYTSVFYNQQLSKKIEQFENDDFVEAVVGVKDIKKYIMVDLISIEKIEKPTNKVVDAEELMKELNTYIEEIQDSELKQLVLNTLEREDVKNAINITPSALKVGYIFEGAFLSHIVRLIRLNKAVKSVFDEWSYLDGSSTKLNMDILIASSVLHDIGVIHAIKVENGKIEKTKQGILLDISALTFKIVQEELAKVNIPSEQRLILEHILGSSREPQFGGLFIPRCREAVCFSIVDSLDVQMANFEYLDRETSGSQVIAQLFTKQLYLGNYNQ